jgi:hypothetical protein
MYRNADGNTAALMGLEYEKLFDDYDRAQRFQSYTEAAALLITVFLYGYMLIICRRRLQYVERVLLSTPNIPSGSGSARKSQLVSLNTVADTVETNSAGKAGRPRRLSVSESLELGQRDIQINFIKLIKARVLAVCVICMLSMSARAAYNLCETSTPPFAHATSCLDLPPHSLCRVCGDEFCSSFDR